MKTVSFDKAAAEFQRVFQLAASGETVVIELNEQRVALHRVEDSPGQEVASPGFFAEDYSADEINELNRFASQGPQTSVP